MVSPVLFGESVLLCLLCWSHASSGSRWAGGAVGGEQEQLEQGRAVLSEPVELGQL